MQNIAIISSIVIEKRHLIVGKYKMKLMKWQKLILFVFDAPKTSDIWNNYSFLGTLTHKMATTVPYFSHNLKINSINQ
jgi:hypothetical protein